MANVPERLDALERQVVGMAKRFDALEAKFHAPPSARVRDSAERDAGDDSEGILAIAASIRDGPRRFNFQHRARFADVLDADSEAVAAVFSALGSPFRVRILRALIDGPHTAQDLQAKLEGAASGQLYHHLKELLAAGLIAQRGRGVYAIREEAVMPVLLAFVVGPRLARPRPHTTDAFGEPAGEAS